MRKFKLVFYPLYILTIIFVLVISANVYESLELFKRWGWFKYFSDLPFMGRNLIVFLSFLMIVEFVVENVALRQLRNKFGRPRTGIEEKETDEKSDLDEEL